MTSGPVPAAEPRARVSAWRRAAGAVPDSLPVVLLAVIAGAGSFTHIRDTAAEHGQRGPMSWAIAVCVDLTCVMAARERQRDKRHGISARRASWPTIVLAAGLRLIPPTSPRPSRQPGGRSWPRSRPGRS
ncbi:MAG TPA: DUF2637 domain-containing protein [Streptosporangiaceae bacterium]|nr:DUF2637 domain-containing protein [Streptosporangiaceae bacterium]HUZ27583.1 DUF2637 domain-containing protein [Streptosporangiaceae bacterium]